MVYTLLPDWKRQMSEAQVLLVLLGDPAYPVAMVDEALSRKCQQCTQSAQVQLQTKLG